MRSTDGRWLGGAALACAIALSPTGARADEPHDARAGEDNRRAPTAENMAMARDALKEGMALRDAGDPAGALSKLHLAYVLVATPVTGYELGKTYSVLGLLLSAREAFLSVGRMPRSIEESERSENARRESERLAVEIEPHIPKLHVHLTLPPGAVATVSVDGTVMMDEAVLAPHSVNPGVHQLTARAGDGDPVSATVEVHADETKEHHARAEVGAAQAAASARASVLHPLVPKPAPLRGRGGGGPWHRDGHRHVRGRGSGARERREGVRRPLLSAVHEEPLRRRRPL